MSVSYFNRNEFSILLPWDKDRLREWLVQAFELLERDAVQSGNARAISAVREALTDARHLTNDSNNGDVLGVALTYSEYLAYALAHPTPTGRVHAAPLLAAAVPYIVQSGQTLSDAPSTLAQWEALASEARRVYPPGDNLLAAIELWLVEYREHGDGIMDRIALGAGVSALAARTVRLGRLYRESLARVRADAAAHDTAHPPTPTPAGDTTATGGTTSSAPSGAVVLLFAIGAAFLLRKKGR